MDCETRKMHNVHRWFILGGLGGFTSRLIARVTRVARWVKGVIHLLTKCPCLSKYLRFIRSSSSVSTNGAAIVSLALA